MSGIRKHLRYVSFFMAMMMALGSVWSATATAGMVGTGEMIGQQQVQLDRQELISRAASLAFPIRNGIPIMLEEEARKLD